MMVELKACLCPINATKACEGNVLLSLVEFLVRENVNLIIVSDPSTTLSTTGLI